MSMEQAILEHAGALRELAAAIKSIGTAQVAISGAAAIVHEFEQSHVTPAVKAQKEAHEAALKGVTREESADKAAPAEAKKDVQAEPSPAEPAAQTAKIQVAPSDELEAAVSKVEEESKALDYKTDVRPVLLALAKKAGQPALKDLLTKYGAATGDKLTADQFAGIVADANKLIAG